MTSYERDQVGPALVAFSLNGIFPEEDLSSRHIQVDDLAPALESLAAAKSKLEVCWCRKSKSSSRLTVRLAGRNPCDQRGNRRGCEPVGCEREIPRRRH